MKLKYYNYLFIIFIIIINNINIIYGQDCDVDYSFDDTSCYQYSLLFKYPQITINNFNIYNQISVEPKPILQSLIGGSYQIQLDLNQTYTFTLKSPNCANPIVFQQSTNSLYKLNVQQPKCLNSYAIIDFDKGDPSLPTSINGVQVLEFPYEMLMDRIDKNKLIYGLCSTYFYLYQQSDKGLPKFSITHAVCGLNGEISIDNSADYSSITVVKFDNTTLSPSSNDNGSSKVYNDLVPGSYSITLVSNECGKQLFTVNIENAQPSYELVLLNDSCPLSAEYQFSMNIGFPYHLVYGGENVTSPFKSNPTYTSLQVNLQPQCMPSNSVESSITVPLEKLYSIPPIHYTITSIDSEELEFCSGRFNVTLIYDPDLVPDIKVISYSSVNEYVTLNYNSFEIEGYDYRYSVYSSCYSELIMISPPSRKPHYSISTSTSKYCNELVDISIDNYLDFTTLQLYSQGITYLPDNGIFRQVPNQLYELQYNYRNCSDGYESIQIGEYLEANIYYTSNIIKHATCENVIEPGLVEFIIYDNFTNKELMKSIQEYYYNDVSPNVYSIYIESLACQEVLLNFEFTQIQPDFKVRTLSKSLCNYSIREGSGGYIEVTSNYSLYEISINDDARELLPAYRVKGGLNTIQVYFSSSDCKTGYALYTSEVEFPNYKIEYDVFPIGDCNSSNGGLKVKDYSKYNKLSFGGNNLLQSGGEIKNKSSDIYSLDFEIQLGNSSQVCKGQIETYIPTSFDVDIQYHIDKQLECIDSYGLASISSIKDKNGNQYVESATPISNIYLAGPYYEELYGHNNIVFIKSGTCSWYKAFNISYQEPSIPFATINVDQVYVKECIAYTRYKVNFNDDYSEANGYTNFNENLYHIMSSNSNDFEAYVSSGSCSLQLTLKAQQPIIPSIQYNIQFNGDSACLSGYTTINISIIDYQNYSSLSYEGIQIGSNGVFANVRPGGYIVGTLFNLDCEIQTQVIVDKPLISIDKSVVNETCYSSLNGQLSIQDSSDSHYYMVQEMNYYTTVYPVNSDQDLLSFGLLGSQDIKIIKANKLNPTCIAYEQFTMESNEPEIITTILNDKCENGTVYAKLSHSSLSGEYSIINGTLNNSTDPAETLIPKLLLSLSSSSSSSSLISSSSSSSSSLSTNEYIVTNLTYGNYTIIYQTKQDYCKRKIISPVSIQVETCTTNNKDDKLGLKIGLPIGLFFLVAFIGVGIYLYKKKLQSSSSKAVKMNSLK